MVESLQVSLRSELETQALGLKLAAAVEPAAVIALVGDLGAGKTRLVQALATGLGVDAFVNSPTFTLIHEYSGRLPLRHCDTYRLKDPDEFADLGLDELLAPDGVAAIEWADRVLDWLPRDHLQIRFEIVGPAERRVTLTARGPQSRRILARL